MNTDIVLEP